MTAEPGPKLAALLESWKLSLGDRDVSEKTVDVYMRTGNQLVAYLAANGLPDDTEGIDAPHLRAFLGAEIKRTSAVSAHQHYRNMRVLFKWLIRDGERAGPNPMDRVDPPQVSVTLKEILPEADVRAILRACEGQSFEARRDMAILRIFIDTGVRVSGLGNVALSDVNLSRKTVKVTLKGGDEHLIPLGRKAVAALDRYIRARARHKHANASEWLWLGLGGRDPGHFGPAGIQDMLERRAKQAGLGKITPHAFRRTFAHLYLKGGGSVESCKAIGGWKTTAMVEHYAGALAMERAREDHERLSPGDRL